MGFRRLSKPQWHATALCEGHTELLSPSFIAILTSDYRPESLSKGVIVVVLNYERSRSENISLWFSKMTPRQANFSGLYLLNR